MSLSCCPNGLTGSCRNSRRMVLLIVFIALFLDFMLMTVIVPILPNYLRSIDENETPKHQNKTQQQLKNAKYFLNNVRNLSNLSIEGSLHGKTNQSLHGIFSKGYLNDPFLGGNSDNKNNTSPGKSSFNYDSETIRVGLLLGSKGIVQLIAAPFIGPVTDRIGYSIPMFVGFIVVMTSSIVFAFGKSYLVLFVARAVQGFGSSCSSVSGLGMLAAYYQDPKERGQAMGTALTGLAIGVLVAPSFGGFMYHFAGKEAPLLCIAGLAFLNGCLQLCTLDLSVKPDTNKGTSIVKLLKDPYILISAGTLMMGNISVAILEPALPVWMYHNFGSSVWEQGIAFLPITLAYMIGLNLFGWLANKCGQWVVAIIGVFLTSAAVFAVSFATNIFLLIPSLLGVGLSVGMTDSSMMPFMGHLVDVRHESVYGSIYAIADISFCIAFSLGPILSGTLVGHFGFRTMTWVVAGITFVFAPLICFLRSPATKEEKLSLIRNEQTSETGNGYHHSNEQTPETKNGYHQLPTEQTSETRKGNHHSSEQNSETYNGYH